MTKARHDAGRRLTLAAGLFFALAFLLLGLRRQDSLGYLLAAAVPALLLVSSWVLPRLFSLDRPLLTLTNLLCALGILLLYRMDPSLALRQICCFGAGLAAMLCCLVLVRRVSSWSRIAWGLIPLSLLFLALPLLSGRTAEGAPAGIALGPVSLDPGPFVRPALALVLASFLPRRKPLPWLLYACACLVLLLLRQDFGTALGCFGAGLLLFWASSGSLFLSLLGLAAGAGALWYAGSHWEPAVQLFSLWLGPGADSAATPLRQGLQAIAEGGLWGSGLGLGSPPPLSGEAPELIFAVLCEQFGQIAGGCVLLLYIALILRAAAVAMSARRAFHGHLAMGSVLLLGLQAFLGLGGALGLIPFTGTPLPFLSWGGSSLVSCLCLVGFIQGVESVNAADLTEDARLAMLDRT